MPKKLLPWSQLYVSTPNGLSCTFLPETYCGVLPAEDNEPHRLVVKQTFVSKCDEKAGEHVKNLRHELFKEKSRTIKSDGTVIKYLENGNVEIYYPNGTIYKKINEIVLEIEPEHVDIEQQQQQQQQQHASKDKDKNNKCKPIKT